MRILALNAYHGGSHRAFLDGWVNASRHEWTVLTLPPHHWKWRMRHAAITFGRQISDRSRDQTWDILLCTDMMNLAELFAFVPASVRALPKVIYFHENQLTYPDDFAGERDLHFAFTHFTSALAADQVWFNSTFHRDVFFDAMRSHLKRMPDQTLDGLVPLIEAKARVESPGIEWPAVTPSTRAFDADEPLHLVWAARWEHDKGPELLFDALRELRSKGVQFCASVLGESFRDTPACFAQAKDDFENEIVSWGFAERPAYLRTLLEADAFISTARHEFFGIAAVEAAAAGCVPIVPRALAYPQVLGDGGVYYEPGNVDSLVATVIELETWKTNGRLHAAQEKTRNAVQQFEWQRRAVDMDSQLETLAKKVN